MSKAFNRLQPRTVMFHVSEPYSNAEETRARYILICVCREMQRRFHSALESLFMAPSSSSSSSSCPSSSSSSFCSPFLFSLHTPPPLPLPGLTPLLLPLYLSTPTSLPCHSHIVPSSPVFFYGSGQNYNTEMMILILFIPATQ